MPDLVECRLDGHTILQQLRLATAYLEATGVAEAKENAEQLLLYILKLDRAQLLMKWHDPFPAEALLNWTDWLQRKGEGEPLQYILGEAWFYGRRYEVSPSVLIPRPETELLVEAILEEAAIYEQSAITVLDVGTGSGAIAITLQKERAHWQVIASDISSDALEQAKRNAALYDIEDKLLWVEGDLLQPFIQDDEALMMQGARIDIVVSNPPYIPKSDMEGLQREVKDYEPELALVGGQDGLDPYRRMIEVFAKLEHKPKMVAFELGIHQPAIVSDMLKELGAWDRVRIITDYNGIDRHVIAIKN